MKAFCGTNKIILLLCITLPISTQVHANIKKLPKNHISDYQLGGIYTPEKGVNVIVADSTASPTRGFYNICYVNGFQTQPDDTWPSDLLLTRDDGEPIIDPNWPDERIMNISTPNFRQAIFEKIKPTIEICSRNGFDAIEFDNLDSFTRSEGKFNGSDAIEFAKLLVQEAHKKGLAAGQKNYSEASKKAKSIAGYDFAISEECAAVGDCGDYTEAYGDNVINIEYTDNIKTNFDEICNYPSTPRDTELRDRKLKPEGNKGYIYQHCNLY